MNCLAKIRQLAAPVLTAATLAVCLLVAPVAAHADTALINTVKPPVDDTTQKLILTIPGAEGMWKNCYDDCRQHQECNPSMCSSHCVGEVMSMAKNTQDVADMMKYNVMAAMGAQCIGKMADYVNAIRTAMTSISSGDPLEAIANALIDAIADQIMSQILTSLTNEICSVTSQILNYADSIIKNAICLPAGTIGNPFNFNLNLKDMQCTGMSINLLTGQTNGTLVNGVTMPTSNYSVYSTGTTAATSGAITPAPTLGATTTLVPVINTSTDAVTVPTVTQ